MSFIVPEAKRLVQPGQKFSRLTVAGVPFRYKFPGGHSGQLVVCECECGKFGIPCVHALIAGKVKSCGCLKGRGTHGNSEHRVYKIFHGMKARCYNPNTESYYLYGQRGITICDEWLNDFGAFFTWAINSGYDDTLSIDRIDNSKGYSPDNCRWATPKEQTDNRSICKPLTAFGETKLVRDWARDDRCIVSGTTLTYRLRDGMGLVEAMTTRAFRRHGNGKNARHAAFGDSMALIEWVDDDRCRVNYNTLRYRVSAGWDIERAISTPARPVRLSDS